MKTNSHACCSLTAVSLLAFGPVVFGQVLPPPAVTNPAPASPLEWAATARDGLSTTWEATERVTNATTGAVTTKPHKFTEIASGLNYQTTNGWQPSQDLIELTADGGAAAVHGPAKLYLKPNLNSAGAITIITVSNRVFRARPLGIFWYNGQSGQAVLVAPVQDCVGELVPPNSIVWKAAFGPIADLRLTYTKGAIESDLVLVQQPTLPAGWDPGTTRLELWHDWTGSPTPAQRSRVLYTETDAGLRSRMAEPDLTDHILDFGELWFPTGAAYATDGLDSPGTNVARQVRVPNLGRDAGLVGVAKTWLTTANALVESVRWPDLQPKFANLPPGTSGGAFQPPQTRSAWLRALPGPNSASSPQKKIELAATGYRPAGVVLDWGAVTGGGSFWQFWGNTWYVSGPAWFSGQLDFGPGAVIKYGNYATLGTYGSIVCWSDPAYNDPPTVFTTKDDDIVGEVLPDNWYSNPLNTHTPGYAANTALWAYYVNSPVTFVGLRIRWAHTGIQYDSYGGPMTFRDSALECCETGLRSNNGGGSIENVTQCGVGTPTSGEFSGSLTDVCPGDSDWDGIPDWWMVGHFGHPTGNSSDYSLSYQDPDCDGVDNLHEYLNGTNPRDWPQVTGLADQVAEQAANATFSFTPSHVVGWNWYKNGQFVVGGVNPVTFQNVQPPDAPVSVVAFNYVGVTSASANLYVLNPTWWDNWTYYNANSSGKNSHLWVDNWVWDPAGPLYPWNGFTAIGYSGYGNGFGGYAVNALSKYHGITAGHIIGCCSQTSINQNVVGTVVTFYENDGKGTPHQVTVADAIVHYYAQPDTNCLCNDNLDYTVLLFTNALPDSITVSGMRVLTSPPSEWGQPYRPYIGTSIHYNNVTPFEECVPWLSGTSGSPKLVPMGQTGGYQLVMYGMCSTAVDWGQVQTDMTTLSQRWGINPAPQLNVQPSW